MNPASRSPCAGVGRSARPAGRAGARRRTGCFEHVVRKRRRDVDCEFAQRRRDVDREFAQSADDSEVASGVRFLPPSRWPGIERRWRPGVPPVWVPSCRIAGVPGRRPSVSQGDGFVGFAFSASREPVGGSRSVLLPHPDGPVSATISPGLRVSETSSSARIRPLSKLFGRARRRQRRRSPLPSFA